MRPSLAHLVALVTCLTSLPGPRVYAQDSHVQSRYVKDTDTTVVTSDTLYVVNMPAQFMALQLTSRHPNQGPPGATPEHTSLQFYSYTPAPLYQKDEAHRLAVKADDEVLDFGLMGYALFRQSGKDTFSAEKNSRLGVRSLMPPDALVRSANGGKDLVLETMSVTDVPLDRLAKLSRARQVLMRIGGTVFPLTQTQHAILREFVAAITPAGGARQAAAPTAGGPVIPPDVPSDSNNAPLDLTLRWLKKELSRHGSAMGVGVPQQIEADDFSGCQIKYRIIPALSRVPGASNLAYAITEYQLSLADLNPESVRAADLKDFSTVFFQTRDNEPKIKVFSRANDGGHAGRVMDEKTASGASFNLRDKSAAAQLRAAFTHAIRLCQSRP
jgi:hypothetical protein